MNRDARWMDWQPSSSVTWATIWHEIVHVVRKRKVMVPNEVDENDRVRSLPLAQQVRLV